MSTCEKQQQKNIIICNLCVYPEKYFLEYTNASQVWISNILKLPLLFIELYFTDYVKKKQNRKIKKNSFI